MEANEESRRYALDHGQLLDEARRLDLVGAGESLESATLTHNPLNQITGAIDRVRWDGGSAVRKVVTPGGVGAAHWSASERATDWNYWQREILAYRTALPHRLGLDAPSLLGEVPQPDGGVALWLEDIDAQSGSALGIDDLAATARQLGQAQGRPDQPTDTWLSVDFIADYAASKPSNYGHYVSDASWAHPYVVSNWPATVRSGFTRLWEQRGRCHELLRSLPRTVCHLDLWPNNIVRRPSGSSALLDWSFTGHGALGEDIGNLIPDAVLDLLVPADRIGELERAVFDSYVLGLGEAGWDGDPELVRTAMHASAVKYYWLPPLLLDRCADPVHYAYGHEVDPDFLYRERGVALALLAEWGTAALAQAADHGC